MSVITSWVISDNLNFNWPSGGGTEVFINSIQGRSNSAPLKMQSIDGPSPDDIFNPETLWYEDIIVNGYFFNAVTGLQFEPYGPSSSAPSVTATGPLVPPNILPLETGWWVRDGIWPTAITIPAKQLAFLIDSQMSRDTWYKIVFSYDNQYPLVPIQFDNIAVFYNTPDPTYKMSVSTISGDYAPVTAWNNLLVDGVTPSYVDTGFGRALISWTKAAASPTWVSWDATCSAPGAASQAYQNNIPHVTSTSLNGNELTITGLYLDKWWTQPDARVITEYNGTAGWTTLTYVSSTALRITSSVGFAGAPDITIRGTGPAQGADPTNRTYWQLVVVGTDRVY